MHDTVYEPIWLKPYLSIMYCFHLFKRHGEIEREGGKEWETEEGAEWEWEKEIYHYSYKISLLFHGLYNAKHKVVLQ